MTDEQIVRALECCVSSAGGDACRGCPYEEEGICVTDGLALQRDSLALIKRQQEDKERLEIELQKAKAEIEEQDKAILNALKRMGEVRAEAVREFAKFLIDKAENNVIRIGDLCDYVIDFNEMTEEKK